MTSAAVEPQRGDLRFPRTAPPAGARRLGLLEERLCEAFLARIAAAEPYEPAPDELQREADAFRRAHGLLRAADTHAWLAENGLDGDGLERLLRRRIRLRRVRDRVAAGRVETWFEAHRGELDRAKVALMLVADAALAEELARRLRRGEADFAELARAHSLLPDAAHSGGFVGAVTPASIAVPGVAAAIFTGRPGAIVGPVRTDAGSYLVHLLELRRARLTPALEEEIRDRILDEWVERRLAAAAPELERFLDELVDVLDRTGGRP